MRTDHVRVSGRGGGGSPIFWKMGDPPVKNGRPPVENKDPLDTPRPHLLDTHPGHRPLDTPPPGHTPSPVDRMNGTHL